MRIAAALIAAAALASQAHAASAAVPREIIGQWCLVKQEDRSTSYYASRGAREQCSDEVLVIKTDRYEGSEFVCRYTKIKNDDSTSQIDSKCDGEGWTWTQHATISLSKGRLVVKVRQTSKERR